MSEVWISSTRRSAEYSPQSSGSPVFTGGLLAFPYPHCRLAGPLRHVHASRVPGLLRGLRPIPRLQPTTCLSRQPGWVPGGRNDAGWFPCSLRIDRSAWHPALPRQHRHGYAAGLHRGLPAGTPSRRRSRPPASGGRALHPGPYPPDLSRCHAYGALTLVPLVYRLISLAGPGPSGSTRPSRLCQRCFPPSPASPGSDCAQLPPSCCDSPARRSRTSFDSQRLTAHQRLVAHHQEFGILGHLAPGQQHQAAEQTAHGQVDDRKDHSAMIPTARPSRPDPVIEPRRPGRTTAG